MLQFDKMGFGGAKEGDISKDKTLQRILKQVEKLKRMEAGDVRNEKTEHFVRFVLDMMRKRPHDSLLQSTSLWSLLTLVSIDKQDVIQVMLRAGVSVVLHNIMKDDALAPPATAYASQLISLLCSGGLGDSAEDVSLYDDQTSVLKRNFDANSVHNNSSEGEAWVDDMSSLGQTHASGLHSFAPYHIDDENVKLMNTLFDENSLWRDINDSNSTMHKIGNALEGSVGGESSVSNSGQSHCNSSTSEFWDSLYQRYNSPAPIKSSKSMTRHRLEAAVRSSHSRTRDTIASPHQRVSSRRAKTASEMFPSMHNRLNSPKSDFRLTNIIPKNNGGNNIENTNTDGIHTEAIVPDYLTRLDPLSINVSTTLRAMHQERSQSMGDDVSVIIEARSSHSDSSSECSSSNGSDAGSDDDRPSHNMFFRETKSNHVRIRAEKLHDMKFIRRMFRDKRMTIKDTQELIAKLEDILELMDRENSGYVSWKVFSRVLVSISPKHLLRSDIENFLSAQVDDENDLVDYKEFCISGKVMVVENKEGVAQILARSWYSRQRRNKAFAALGDDDPTSTYTWKNHVKWFKKRKADALIWLMRRANRAIKYYAYVENAQSYLLQVGVFGKALTGLIEAGTRALEAQDKNRNIRISLSRRAIHARDYRRKREEARQYLYYKSHPEVLTPQEEKRKEVLRIQKQKEEHYHKAFSPGIGKVYRLMYVTKEATEYLKRAANLAKEKCRKQDAAFEWLSRLGQQTAKQEVAQVQVQRELFEWGERARQYCILIDKALLGLFRWGEFALEFFDRQDSALKWLLSRASRAKEFDSIKQKTFNELLYCGKHTLQVLNRRERGFGFLSQRAVLAQDLRRNQLAAVKYLRSIPEKIYKNAEQLENAHEYLVGKARHALKHQENTLRAAKYLITVASRSVAVSRRRNMAQADLKQIGNQALRAYFEKLWVPLPGNKQRLRDEVKRINTQDKRLKAVRKKLGEEEKWMAELMDAFSSLANAFSSNESNLAGVGRSNYSKNAVNSVERTTSNEFVEKQYSFSSTLDQNSSVSNTLDNRTMSGTLEKKPSNLGSVNYKTSSSFVGEDVRGLNDFDDSLEIGRLGFKQLIKDGKMLGLPKGTADACYETVDADGSGGVSFKEVWKWFRYQALRRSAQKPGSVVVDHASIIPAKDRAIVALMKRFARQPVSGGKKRRPSTADDIDLYG